MISVYVSIHRYRENEWHTGGAYTEEMWIKDLRDAAAQTIGEDTEKSVRSSTINQDNDTCMHVSVLYPDYAVYFR